MKLSLWFSVSVGTLFDLIIICVVFVVPFFIGLSPVNHSGCYLRLHNCCYCFIFLHASHYGTSCFLSACCLKLVSILIKLLTWCYSVNCGNYLWHYLLYESSFIKTVSFCIFSYIDVIIVTPYKHISLYWHVIVKACSFQKSIDNSEMFQ